MDMTLIIFASSSLSGEEDSLLANIKHASAFLIFKSIKTSHKNSATH